MRLRARVAVGKRLGLRLASGNLKSEMNGRKHGIVSLCLHDLKLALP
jgi:hypothetical protein